MRYANGYFHTFTHTHPSFPRCTMCCIIACLPSKSKCAELFAHFIFKVGVLLSSTHTLSQDCVLVQY